jgi:3-polyprenyl-4-hydroxybenzoate decarboxylase
MIYPSPKKYSRKIMGYVKKKEKKRHIAHVSKISKRREDKIMLLTVKIRQPSHEFTFGVGMSFIPYPLVLTPVV